MAKDFSSDQGDVQGVAPNTKAPMTSDAPEVGFSNPGNGQRERAEFGPGPGLRGNTKKIH